MEEKATGQSSGDVRYRILLILFVTTTVSFADRATLSFTGPAIQNELHIDAATLGYIFSAFGWAYAASQIPSGWLLDRYGSRGIYTGSVLLWSLFTLLQGSIGVFSGGAALIALFGYRLLMGVAAAPIFPGNSRLVAAWFPTAERGTAAAIFNASQYVAVVVFSPLMAWMTVRFGWTNVFFVMGIMGIALFFPCLYTIYDPSDHPRVNPGELRRIAQGGALLHMNSNASMRTSSFPIWPRIRKLTTNRTLLGVYIAQYCINTMTYFFLTWFPIYLVQQRGMSILKAGFVASLPAVCGFMGGVLGGVISDFLLRRELTLTVARKVPIVGGLLMSTAIIGCNYVQSDWLVVLCMSIAFFGKGVGALGWAVVADISPRQMAGLSGALFNTFGNVAAITTPIVIGYIVASRDSFAGALVFVAVNAVVAVMSYLLIVGPIQRIELSDDQALPASARD
jgi:MFS transporter, ACS family, glucarate transporter